MPIVQFRIHPGVGCARMGNSGKAYHLASEFPYFLQEEFPNLRFRPRPRVHPKKFFGSDTTSSISPAGNLAAFEIFDTTGVFDDKFKETEGTIFPQAARFRVFAYVYKNAAKRTPQKVFEVTADIADIVWNVKISNKKSTRTTAPATPRHVSTATSSDFSTDDTRLICKRLLPPGGPSKLPNLAYVFLERDEVDTSKLTGRLHVIGNEGEFVGSLPPTSLWSDDWYDSAGDGSVQATVKPKGDLLHTMAGASSVADLQYFDYGTAEPKPGATGAIVAMPAWVVIGCPDYVPDMGHFVSLWDIALDRGFRNLEKSSVIAQPDKHKLIRRTTEIEKYKQTDYLIHIHPHLCLFEDVRFVSGEAFAKPESGGAAPGGRGHNLPPGPPPPAANESEAIKQGGAFIKARQAKDDLKNPAKLKDSDSTQPIGKWLKRAVVSRLRKPTTLYDKDRKFVIKLPLEDPAAPGQPRLGTFPRKLGRRLDYDRPDGDPRDRDSFYEFPQYLPHEGNLLKFHGLPHAGKYCGGDESPPTAGPPGSSLTASELELLQWMDDMYWPATVADMPLLRELAYTPHQYKQFEVWQGKTRSDVRLVNIFFTELVPPVLQVSFALPGDQDKHFKDFLAARPMYAPAMIDMAYLGTIIGGSFLPGIEVGREAGIATNWCLFHGSTKYFPSIRFKPSNSATEHTLGTLTKDLAVPWSEDFKACDEAFWPTARPGRTKPKAAPPERHDWQITHDKPIPHLAADGGPAGAALAKAADDAAVALFHAQADADANPGDASLAAAVAAAESALLAAHVAAAPFEVRFVQEYWKALGFIRRQAGDEFTEQEQSWH